MPMFSIIMVHYQGTVSHSVFLRGLASLQRQTFKDFELLVYHDGPLTDPAAVMPVPVRCTQVRHNDFGHTLRDIGIRQATGDYIVHFNADNVLYPHALAEIAKELRREPRAYPNNTDMRDNPDIALFPIHMFGFLRVNHLICQLKGQPWFTVMTGNPPVLGNVDCMQLVMRRELWLAEGGWADKRPDSDGPMYERFAAKYGYRPVGMVCGEHH